MFDELGSEPMGAAREDAGQWTAYWKLRARLKWLAQEVSVTVEQGNSKMLQTLFCAVDGADSYRLKPSSD